MTAKETLIKEEAANSDLGAVSGSYWCCMKVIQIE